MARTYKRDANGRFAGGGGGSGGGGKRPAAKPVSRGTNRLTRDNAGKITSVGGNGATARGGRLKTASGKQRATQTAKAIGGSRPGTIKGRVTRNPAAGAKLAAAGKAKVTSKPARKPKTSAQVEAQANRLLDKLKGQRLAKTSGARDYVIRDRIDKVNASTKRVLPRYKHNPLRKGSPIATATRSARQRTNNARYNASLDNWNRGMGR